MDCKWFFACLGCLALTWMTVYADDGYNSFPKQAPSFAKEIGNATVPVGRDATLSCVIYNLANFKVAWVRVDTQTILTIDDVVITRSQRISVRHTADASGHLLHHQHHQEEDQEEEHHQQRHYHPMATTWAPRGQRVNHHIHKTWQLILSDVQPSDAGAYMCQLNTEPMISQTAYLGVTIPPDIVDAESSGDVMVTEGSNSSLRCTAAGHPTPLITWRREDGRPIYNHALTVEGAVLHLSKIPRQSMGAYLCIASNGVPPSVSKRFMLRVRFAPSVTATNQLVGARMGDNVTLECHCESFPRPVVYWLRHGSGDVVVTGGKYHEEKRETSLYKMTMELTFAPLERVDFMAYQCVCRNTLGLADTVVRLYQIHPMVEDSENDVYEADRQEIHDGHKEQQTAATWETASRVKEETTRKSKGSRRPKPQKSGCSRLLTSAVVCYATLVAAWSSPFRFR